MSYLQNVLCLVVFGSKVLYAVSNEGLGKSLCTGSSIDSRIEFCVKEREEFNGKSSFVNESVYSDIEQQLFQENQQELADLSRMLRDLNPYPVGSNSYQIWLEQAQFNVPILVLSSLFLDEFCKKEKIKTILFSQRDCYHWIKIFQTLFPQYYSVDFMTSRVAYCTPTPEYVKYVQELCQEEFVIVDANGTGESCLKFFARYIHRRPLHLAIVRRGCLCPGITYSDYTYIEIFNCAPFGSLKALTAQGAVRFPLEYPVDLIEPAIACVASAIRLLNSFHFQGFNRKAMNILMAAHLKHKPFLFRYHRNQHVK